jgi:PhnB protein
MKVVFELSDQFWGDRTGTVEDPYGYQWTLATQKEDLTLEEIEARREKAGW